MTATATRHEPPLHSMIRRAETALETLRDEEPLSAANLHRLSLFADALMACATGNGELALREVVGRVWLRATKKQGTITEWYARYAKAAVSLKRLATGTQSKHDDPEELYQMIVALL